MFSTRLVSTVALAVSLCAAQSKAPRDWEASRRQDVLQLVLAGRFDRVKELAGELIREAARRDSQLSYQAELRHWLGTAENQLGRYKEAETVLDEGVRLLDREADAPEVLISLLGSLAEARLHLNRLRQAEKALLRALTVASRELPSGHPLAASIWDRLGQVYWAGDQKAKAETAFRKALAILESNFGAAHPDVEAAASNLATILALSGRHAEVLPYLRRSKTELEEQLGPTHIDTIRATYSLGIALSYSAPAEAEKILQEGLDGWRRGPLPQIHPQVSMFHNALAWARWKQKDFRGAVTHNERALDISRELLGTEHPQVVELMDQQSRMLKAARRSKEGAVLKKEADRIRAVYGYPVPERHSIDIRSLRRTR